MMFDSHLMFQMHLTIRGSQTYFRLNKQILRALEIQIELISKHGVLEVCVSTSLTR